MAPSVPFEDVLEEVTRIDLEELQDSSEEKSDKTGEAIESAVKCFIECSDLHFFVKQAAKRHLRGLYEQHARGKDSFSILCESLLNTGAKLKDETCTWLDLIYRRLSARRRIKRPWYLEFTRDIPKEIFLALKRAFSTTTNHDLRVNVCMEGNGKGFSISIAYFLSVLYMFRILTGKTIKQCRVITVSVTHLFSLHD